MSLFSIAFTFVYNFLNRSIDPPDLFSHRSSITRVTRAVSRHSRKHRQKRQKDKRTPWDICKFAMSSTYKITSSSLSAFRSEPPTSAHRSTDLNQLPVPQVTPRNRNDHAGRLVAATATATSTIRSDSDSTVWVCDFPGCILWPLSISSLPTRDIFKNYVDISADKKPHGEQSARGAGG